MAEPQFTAVTLALGDCMMSTEAYPDVDRILAGNEGPALQPENLVAFLKLLELVVLYERLFVPHVPPRPVAADSLYLRAGDIVTVYAVERSHLPLDVAVKRSLAEANVLFFAAQLADLPEGVLSPYQYALHYIERSATVRKAYRQSLQSWRRTVETASGPVNLEPHRSAVTDIADALGVPYMMSTYCAHVGLPLYISPREAAVLRYAELADSRLRRGVIEYLHGRLVDGIDRELQQLAQLGIHTAFPATPIAARILQEASSPHDLVRVALQIRAEFASFRSAMAAIESDLRNENVPLKTKRKRLKSLELLANDLWPSADRAYFKEAWDVTDFLTGAAAMAGAASPLSLLQIIDIAKSAPADIVRGWLRRRKVRVLLKTKKKFLASRSSIAHLASMFRLSEASVRHAVQRHLRDAAG